MTVEPAPKRNLEGQGAESVTLRQNVQAHLIEVFRKALMVSHADDWDMETVSEAAHVCARAWCDEFGRKGA